jgi:hypothetical protein
MGEGGREMSNLTRRKGLEREREREILGFCVAIGKQLREKGIE